MRHSKAADCIHRDVAGDAGPPALAHEMIVHNFRAGREPLKRSELKAAAAIVAAPLQPGLAVAAQVLIAAEIAGDDSHLPKASGYQRLDLSNQQWQAFAPSSRTLPLPRHRL